MYLSKFFMIQIILKPSLVKMYQGKLLDGLKEILILVPILRYTYYFPQKIYTKENIHIVEKGQKSLLDITGVSNKRSRMFI